RSPRDCRPRASRAACCPCPRRGAGAARGACCPRTIPPSGNAARRKGTGLVPALKPCVGCLESVRREGPGAGLADSVEGSCHDDGVLAALPRRVVVAAHAHFLETHARVEVPRRGIGGPHFQERALRLVLAGDPEKVLQQAASQPAALLVRADADIE